MVIKIAHLDWMDPESGYSSSKKIHPDMDSLTSAMRALEASYMNVISDLIIALA